MSLRRTRGQFEHRFRRHVAYPRIVYIALAPQHDGLPALSANIIWVAIHLAGRQIACGEIATPDENGKRARVGLPT